MSEQFNPLSSDAMFATVLLRLEGQDNAAKDWRDETKATLAEIRAEVKKTNGRVTAIEKFISSVKAKAVLVAGAVSAVTTGLMWVVANFEALRSAFQFFLSRK